MVEDAVAEEDGAELDVADEVVADVADQASGAAKSMANQADVEDATD